MGVGRGHARSEGVAAAYGDEKSEHEKCITAHAPLPRMWSQMDM